MVDTTDASHARAFRPAMAGQLGSNTETPGWDLATERRLDDGETLAGFLGWFSIGLGTLELLAPERLERWLGVEGRTRLIQGYGVRGIAKGIGILASRRPAGWVWARVAGDAVDLATLATVLTPDNPRKGNVGLAMGAMAGVAALDVVCGLQLGRRRDH